MLLSQNKRKIETNAKSRILACKFISELLIPVSESNYIYVCTCVYCVCVRPCEWAYIAYVTHARTRAHAHTQTVLGKVIRVRAMKGQAPHGAE